MTLTIRLPALTHDQKVMLVFLVIFTVLSLFMWHTVAFTGYMTSTLTFPQEKIAAPIAAYASTLMAGALLALLVQSFRK